MKQKGFPQKQLMLEHKRRCPVCETIKELDEFYPNNWSRCIPCEKARSPAKFKKTQEKKYESLETVLSMRLKETHISKKYRPINEEHAIDFDYLMECHQKQQGLCYYSNKPLLLTPNSPYTLSVDRIDSAQGYVRGNIALCCKVFNIMKGNQSVEEFMENCALVVRHFKTVPPYSPASR